MTEKTICIIILIVFVLVCCVFIYKLPDIDYDEYEGVFEDDDFGE